jgi:hypothetical protein
MLHAARAFSTLKASKRVRLSFRYQLFTRFVFIHVPHISLSLSPIMPHQK